MIGSIQVPHISFHYLSKPFSFHRRTLLKQHLVLLFKTERRALESLSCIFCSDEYLLNINRQYLGHDYYTDIITFNLADRNDPVLGEIYISIDRVYDNARQLKESFQRELLRVIFHGALHLCGYRDKTGKEIFLMRNKEDFYLDRFVNS